MRRAPWRAVVIIAIVALVGGFAAVPSRASGDTENGACGFPPYQPCKVANDASVLLSPAVLASVVGSGWTRHGSGPMRPLAGAPLINDCMYDGPGEDDDAILTVRTGGRAQFEHTIKNLGHGLKPVSGVGDAAYAFAFPGSPANGVELWVLKGDTYFDLKLDSADPKLTQWGPALARKVADQIK